MVQWYWLFVTFVAGIIGGWAFKKHSSYVETQALEAEKAVVAKAKAALNIK